jgi:hypothetical protein
MFLFIKPQTSFPAVDELFGLPTRPKMEQNESTFSNSQDYHGIHPNSSASPYKFRI